LAELVHAIREYRKISDSQPLTLQGSDYPHAVQELNKAIDREEGRVQFPPENIIRLTAYR
jgi:hypothetical protein